MRGFYIFSYDIKLDKKRNKIANVMKDYGVRVQYSVFECLIDKKEYDTLITKIKEIFNSYPEDTDSLRIYKLCGQCKEKIHSIGSKNVGADLHQQKTIII
ncbi:UNVERIFIED_CONTAM: CRISPR-associated protein Cas2 [Acetivibrio alkalicellulosi]